MSDFWLKLPRPILALAPMAGVTDWAFRKICKQQGADVVYTEMISAAGLFYRDKKTRWFLKTDREEQPCVAQLFGFEPEHFKVAVKEVEDAGFSGVDINFGCPARKVVKNFSGSALMNDISRAGKILETVCANTSLPVSIKVRSSKGEVTASHFLSELKDLPIKAIMLHARSFEQVFDGDLNLEEAKKVREMFKGIFLINGGINNFQKASELLKITEADGVGLGRGVWGKPWLFEEIKAGLENREFSAWDWEKIKNLTLKHAEINLEICDNLVEMRKHLLWYAGGFAGAKALRQELIKVKTLDELRAVLR